MSLSDEDARGVDEYVRQHFAIECADVATNWPLPVSDRDEGNEASHDASLDEYIRRHFAR